MERVSVIDAKKLGNDETASFQALGNAAAWPSFTCDTLWVSLEGAIQMRDGKLTDVESPAGAVLMESLLKSYRAQGEECLRDLAGSFRLALWDLEQEKLVIATDPFASRPIYFLGRNERIFFAPRISDFSAVPGLSREVDPNALFFYINHSFVPAPYTAFRGIRRLEPGQYLCWRRGKITTRQYWDIKYDEDRTVSEDEFAERVRSTVEASVRSCLDAQVFSQAEVGAFLSGGTDSSTLVGLMTQIRGPRIKTFSVGFSEEPYNEIRYAKIAASHYQADAHDVFFGGDEALQVLPQLAAELDEPFGNSSAIPTYFCLRRAKETGVKVMFAGDGGDELFGGNDRYVLEKLFRPFDVLPGLVQGAISRASRFAPVVYPFGKIKRYVEQAALGNPRRFFRYQLFVNDHADEFLTDDFKALIDLEFALRVPERHYRKTDGAAALNRLLYMDLKMCIADNDLFKVNHMANMSGIGVWYPYLNKELAELTGKIHADLKIKRFHKRYIFKRAFENLLPPEILRKKKHGFGMPTGEWLRYHSGFRDLARSLLLDAKSIHRGYFKRSGLERLLKLHDEETSSYYGTYIWYFMMLELWHRYHVDGMVRLS